MKKFITLLFVLITVCSLAVTRGGAQYDPDAARRNLSNVVDAMTLTLSGLLTAGEASFGTTGTQFNSAGALVMPNNTAIGMKQAGGDIKTFGYMNPSDQMQFGQSGQIAYFPGSSIIASGNVLIATSTDDGANKLQVNGFSKFGEAATGIKMKVLTGTTAAAEGGLTTIAHGLTGDNILSFSAKVHYITNGGLLPHSPSAGYTYVCDQDLTNININLDPTNSENILSKPITVVIWYKG